MYAQFVEVFYRNEVRLIPGCDGPDAWEGKITGRIDGGHLDGDDRIKSQADGLAHTVVHPPLGDEVCRMAIIGDEHAASEVERGDDGEQLLEILGS